MATIVIFLVILSILVIVHEFGHFITAKKFGMRVYEFGVGFPPRAFGVYKDPVTGKWKLVKGKGKSSLKETIGGDERVMEYPATLYSFNWLPLGGFVKIKGESGEHAQDKDSFGHHKAWKRLVVLVAGVAMNIILAGALLSIGFALGLPVDVSDGLPAHAHIVKGPAVVVQQVVDDSPAKQAGVASGDTIVSINTVPVAHADELVRIVAEHGTSTLLLEVEHEGRRKQVSVTPEVLKESTEPKLGLLLAEAAVIRYPWYEAVYRGFMAAGIGFINIFIALYFLLKNLITGHGLAFDVSGPVGIAAAVGQSARMGFQYLLNITAMISLSLAAINILPIPALDGGRALFVIIEKISRRPVPMRYEQLAHTIGFVLLMILIVLVTYRDIAGLIR